MSLNDFQKAFYDRMYPLAQQASAATGIDPDIIFAQAALESNWGKSAPNNNFFGIKGGNALQTTMEYINGKWVQVKEAFKGYSSMAESVDAYVALMKGSRYTGVRTGGSEAVQLGALQGSGYATDPNYSNKLKSIIASLPGGGTATGGVSDVFKQVEDALKGADKWVADKLGVPDAAYNAMTNPTQSITDYFGRISAVVIGVILIGLAIAALVLLSGSGKELASSAVKAAA